MDGGDQDLHGLLLTVLQPTISCFYELVAHSTFEQSIVWLFFAVLGTEVKNTYGNGVVSGHYCHSVQLFFVHNKHDRSNTCLHKTQFTHISMWKSIKVASMLTGCRYHHRHLQNGWKCFLWVCDFVTAVKLVCVPCEAITVISVKHTVGPCLLSRVLNEAYFHIMCNIMWRISLMSP